ncbi:hypothetical protein ACFFKC_00475 [Pseudoduganella danionis]|uniref:Uncharacterized protein n=1 Tax=Pseudoduganella danionis TaxID=1890295 RepID=A0ABW9SJK8_9BURK|nr:hypothetical protein [Pseudoduganella danionis]MTW32011.1 hypothetical protein [Pseudoduganella danionis]
MARPQAAPIARDWLGKTLAGILLGFTLALGCSALFVWLAASLPQSARSQLAMWLLAPVWIGVLGGVFFFRSGKQAWLWLGAANLLVFLIPILGRHF